jgi:LuxR family transcriptional regulator, maltose regulon positive regulatory protein
MPNVAINKISPIATDSILARTRLFTVLQHDTPGKAFWLSGPGGCGKTSLVASYLNQAALPVLWYHVDSRDRDPATFFYYFGKAAMPLLAAEAPMPLLTPEYLAEIDTFILGYFETLFQRIPSHSWLVLDNVQEALDDSGFVRLLGMAVQQMTANMNIGLLSRTAPPPSMTRYVANRQMVLVDWPQLAFTADELQAFFSSSQSDVPAAVSSDLHRLTKGWIAGAILWHLCPGLGRGSEALSTQQAPESIFDYFMSEIFEKTRASEKEFLLRTAFLPVMTVEMAAQLTFMEREAIRELLHRKNYFLERHQTSLPSFSYHPLFREFLLRRAAESYDQEELQSLLCHAGSILKIQGMIEEAVALYNRAGDHQALAAIILADAKELIAQGRYAVLGSWLAFLPEASVSTSPWLIYWQGVAKTVADPPASSLLFDKAYQMFIKNGDLVGQICSWTSAVEILIFARSGFVALDRWIADGERLGRMLSEEDAGSDMFGRFASGMLLALLLRNLGHPEIWTWQERCETLMTRCSDPQVSLTLASNLCWSYFWLGKTPRSQTIEERLRVFHQIDSLPPLARILTHLHLGFIDLGRGKVEECRFLVREALAISKKCGIHMFDFWLTTFLAYGSLGLGELDDLPACFEKMQANLLPYSTWDHGNYQYLLAWYNLQGGHISAASKHLITATKLAEECGGPFPIAICGYIQALIFLEQGEAVKGQEVLAAMRRERRFGDSRVITMYIDLGDAACALHLNQLAKADAFLGSAFAAVRRESTWPSSGLTRSRLSCLCNRALEARIEEETATTIIRRWKLPPPDSVVISDHWPWPIQITTLGRFTVCCENGPWRLSAKTPKKLLEFLTVLICAGADGISRDRIGEILWPDSDADMAIQAFHTALHRLRKMLGTSESIQQDGNLLTLNRQICYVDSWEFIEVAKSIEESSTTLGASRELIEAALSRYGGSFATGQEQLNIALDYGQTVNRRWLEVLSSALMVYVHTEPSHDIAAQLQRAFADDHTLAKVLKQLYQKGQRIAGRDEALRRVGRCREFLLEKGVAPGPKTSAVLRDLQMI